MNVYKEIHDHFDRLKKRHIESEEFKEMLSDVLYYHLPDEEYEKIEKGGFDGNSLDMVSLLLHEDILIKIIGIMEVSDTWEEFEKLYKKKKKPKKELELTDFEKLLKAMVKVPKPPKDKK